MDEAVSQCDVCDAFEKAPHLPAAWTSPTSPFNGKLQVDPLPPGDATALHALDMYSEHSLLVKVCSGDPKTVSDARDGSRIAVSGRHQTIQMDAGGEW